MSFHVRRQFDGGHKVLFYRYPELGITALHLSEKDAAGHRVVTVSQSDLRCVAEALITVADRLEAAAGAAAVNARGLPGYTFERAAGETWRSRFDAARNLIVVNSGHRDFVFATRNRALQLRYLVRLYVKELVLHNFVGLAAEQVAERMIEVSLYVEEKLKLP